jgi:hypothetical protein
MKLNFINLPVELEKGISIMEKYYNFENSTDGISVCVKRSEEIKVDFRENTATVFYKEKIHFFRALGLLLENIENKKEFCLSETAYFQTSGVMLDMSRNGVMKISGICDYLRYMAIMGLNVLQLYLEDVYEVPNYPYFGYMRGRYSYEELKECDDYADIFGIEIIPCIQTLGHMEQYLKWDFQYKITDKNGVMLIGADETYELIDHMIKAASAPFRSKRIHIGMDEAGDVGLGMYLNKNGYKRRFDILVEHLEKIYEICEKYQLKPMMWSDMFFRLASKTESYYDLSIEVPQDVIDKIPENMQLVYWDYYHVSEKFYYEFSKKHIDLGKDIIFAGGIWTWRGFVADNHFTNISTNAALMACKRSGVKEVLATMWSDDGCETNHFLGLLGVQLYAEHMYCYEPSKEHIRKRFNFCTGADYDCFMKMSDLQYNPEIEIPKATDDTRITQYLKQFIWQDVLFGLADEYLKNVPMSEYYNKVTSDLKEFAKDIGKWSEFYEYTVQLGVVATQKCSIAENLQVAYKNNDTKYLTSCANELFPQLKLEIEKLHEIHKKQWFSTYKAFGWEVLDLRYGGLILRIQSSINRINDFLTGKVDNIEELEVEKIVFNSKIVSAHKYIYTACVPTYL